MAVGRIQLRRGTFAALDLGTLYQGEAYYCTDTKQVYIGHGDGSAITAGIVESGSNGNGTYIKYADGTMICTKRVSLGSVGITTAAGNLFMSGTVSLGNWAAAFHAVPIAPMIMAHVVSGIVWASVFTYQTATVAPQIRVMNPTSQTLTVTVDVVGIGRWKA